MKLDPVLGPIALIFYGIGIIIGAGIYSVVGVAAGLAQEGLWLSFLAGALVAFLTALSYAEMTAAFPAAGAAYIYLNRAFPKMEWAGFLVGLIVLMGGAATATTVAVSFGGYLKLFIDMPIILSAFVLLALSTALNIWGLRQSSAVNIVLTLVEIGGLVLVIAAGLTHADSSTPFTQPLQTASPLQPGIMAASAVLFFVYLGFEELANLAEEARKPERDLPLAIFASLGITTILYVLVALSLVTLAQPSALAKSEAPLVLAVSQAWPGSGNFLGAIALFATANTVLVTLVATSRMAFSMGRDKEIPALFANLLSSRHTPYVAALFAFATACMLLPIGSIKILAELSSFAALAAFLGVNISLIALRYRLPGHRRPFRVPFSVGRLPLLPLLAIAAIIFLMAYFDWRIYAAGAITIIASLLIFAFRAGVRRFKRRRASHPKS